MRKINPSQAQWLIEYWQQKCNDDQEIFYLIQAEEYQKRFPYNGEKEFHVYEIDEAKNWQSYFPNYAKNNIHSRCFQFLQRYINFINDGRSKYKSKAKFETLIDIWEGDLSVYHTYIDYLKKNNPQIESPFIDEYNGQLTWIKKPQKGYVQYLAAFIYTCIIKNWIQDSYSATEYKNILANTFNIDFNTGPFKSLTGTPPDEKYLKPFRSLPANVAM
jgi:hypothetical protein